MTPAQRQAACRRRQRLGLARITVELDELRLIEALVSLRVLDAEQSNNPAAVALALENAVIHHILSRRDFTPTSFSAMSLRRRGRERGEAI
jgi:hypothetical protein